MARQALHTKFPKAVLTALAVCALFFGELANASTLTIPYSGRVTKVTGQAIAGPIDIEVNFFDAATGGNKLNPAPYDFPATPLTQGVFTLTIGLSSANVQALFPDPSVTTWIEISDNTNHKVYPRQRFGIVPYALKVPVDQKTIAFDSNGELALALSSLPANNQFLTKDSSGNLSWGTPSTTAIQGQGVSSTAPTSGQVLSFSGGQWLPTTLNSGTVTSIGVAAPLAVTSPTTTPQLSLAQANSVANGYLGSADWLTFNNKLGLNGGTMTGALDMGGKGLTGLAAPVNAADAATKAYVDELTGVAFTPVNKAGDTMTGALSVGNNALIGATVRGVNASGSNSIGGSLVINAGNGTGTGGSGGILFQTAMPGASGSTADSLATVGSFTPSGFFGIGSTPTSALDVSGAFTERGMAAPGLSAAGQGRIYFDNGTNHFMYSENGNAYGQLTTGGSVTSVSAGAGLTGGSFATVGTIALATTGTAGSYTKVTTDTYGRVTSGTTLSASDIPPLAMSQITSGTLAVVNGGTGAAAFTNNGVLIGSGGSALSATSAGVQYNVLSVNGSDAPVFGALNLASSAAVSGKLGNANGGTGLATVGSSNQLLGMDNAGSVLEYKTITGTSNQVNVAGSAGAITLSTPQNIHTAASPTFTAIALAGNLVTGTGVIGTPAVGTNILGSNLTVAAGNGTGTGGSGTILFQTAGPAGSSSAANALVTGLAVAPGGNVGLGNTTPSSALDVAGSITTRGIFSPSVSPTGQGRMYFDSVLNHYYYSENGGAYIQLGLGGGTGGGGGGGGVTYVVAGGGLIGGTITTSGSIAMPLVGTPGTYSKVVTDTYGRVSSSDTLIAADLPPFSASLITSGTLALSRVPSLPASTITSGTLALSAIGSLPASTITSGTLALSTVPSLPASTINSGTLALSTVPSLPASTITSGTLNNAQLPVAGTAGTYTKVVTDAYGRVSSSTTLIASDLPPISATLITSGTLPLAVTPSFAASVITSGSFSVGQIPSLPASILTSGTLNTAQLPAAGTAGTYTKVITDAYGRVTNSATLIASDLPPLPASLITTGTLTLSIVPSLPASTITSGTLALSTVPSLPASTISSGTLALSTVPSLPATTISSGTLNMAQLPALAGTYVATVGSTMTGLLSLGTNALYAGTHIAGSSDASTTPVAGILRGASGAGTNIPGAAITIAAGNGSGTGASGAINFQTAPANTTGSSADTLTNVMTIIPGGNVGIGTTAPIATLQVGADYTTTNNGAINFGQWDGVSFSRDFKMGYSSNGVFSFGDNGFYPTRSWTQTMNVTAAGNVGIGTTSPAFTLETAGAIASGTLTGRTTTQAVNDTLFLGPATGNFFIDRSLAGGQTILGYNTPKTATQFNPLAIYNNSTDKTLSFQVNSAGTSSGVNSVSMYPSGGGNVGIGTSVPSALLQIDGAPASTSVGVQTMMAFHHGASSVWDGWAAFALGRYTNADNSSHSRFDILVDDAPGNPLSNANTIMTLLGNGAVGIGTTSPSYNLHVVGTAGLSTGTSWTNASDIRLKDIEGDYEYGLEEIKRLHTVRYKYKVGNALNLPTDQEHTGFIAQEVREVIPDAVNTRKDGFLELNVDPIHWATVNAVQQLALENDQLKARVDRAEADAAELKARVDRAEADSKAKDAAILQLKAILCSIKDTAMCHE